MITVLVLLGLIVILYFLAQYWTEVLWYIQMRSARVLWTQWGTRFGLFAFGFLATALSMGFAIRYGWRHRVPAGRGDAGASMRGYREAVEPVRKLLFIGVPCLIGLMTGSGFSSNWQAVLTWIYRTPFGERDPQFGLDMSFFVFSLPLLEALSGFLVNVLVLTTLAALVVHYLYGGIAFAPRPRATRAARLQLGWLAAGLSLMIGIRYWLGRYALVNQQNDLADGALFTDVHATLPARAILAVISLLVAGLFVYAAFRGTWRVPAVGVGVMVISALVVGTIYPALIQQFRVTPNAIQLEQPYIQRNIDATLKAYGMDDLEYQTYAAKTDATPGQLRQDSDSTSQIRLLDPTIVPPTVRQLQQSRPYYSFANQFSVDRYTIAGHKRDTVIAVRELNLNGLSSEQQTWVNRHTVYTHGFGVVAAYGNQVTSDGLPSYFEQSIPSKGELGDYEPRVYFSPSSPDYSIVGAPKGAQPRELDYPDDNAPSGQVLNTFSGDGGPSIGSLWNRLLYAVKFGSTDVFFSSQTNAASQILYDRDPSARVSKVAPYLTLEQKPYPAVVDMDGNPATPKRLVWIIDGYTSSSNYPYAEHTSLETATADSQTSNTDTFARANRINYMRNSVKAVVDAYDGSVKLYEWDKTDPVVKTWEKVYPGQVKPMSEISADLMSHLRYPEDLFKVQRSLLTSYHVTDASKFYTGGDRWRLSEDPTAQGGGAATQAPAAAAAAGATTTPTQLQPPYYLTMQMPTQRNADFSLTSVFVPGGESKREAMAGFLAVDSETGNRAGQVSQGFGKLRLMALPSSTTVPGPGQVQNQFNANQQIATELNLLDQQGSTVIRGNLLTLPVGGGLLYVEPVYVQSTGSTSYPVLRSVLTAFGDQVGFARTLADSLDQTFGGDSAATVSEGSGPRSGAGSGANQQRAQPSAQQRLDQALAGAQQAVKDSDTARSKGDWNAYGKAQKSLSDAVTKALQAQRELGASASATPSPASASPSPSASAGG